MATRREALWGGLSFASVASSVCLSSACRAALRNPPGDGAPIEALLVDENLAISSHFVTFIRANRRQLPILQVRLDSFAQAGLKRVFDRYQVIAGVSSGATLFCLERIAWDHGFRITRRSEQFLSNMESGVSESGATTRALQTAIILDRPRDFAATVVTGRTYRPSRTDDTLHAWIMQTTVARINRGPQQEI